MKAQLIKTALISIVIFALLWTGSTHALAQNSSTVIQHFTSENGLPQNSVKFLQFDKSGFLWLGTESGLVRYDNRNFQNYGIDNIPALGDERIRDLKIDISGNVYVKNLNYQTLSTIPVNAFKSPVPFLLHEKDDYYYPTWGYLIPTLKLADFGIVL